MLESGIKQWFNENVLNDGGEDLLDFCKMNELKISNIFFQYKKKFDTIIENMLDDRCYVNQ